MNASHSGKDPASSSGLLTAISNRSFPKSIPASLKAKHVPYQVYISTAGYKSAGTNKPVYIQITGDFGNSEFILLDDVSPNIRESGLHYTNPELVDLQQENYGFPSFSVRDFSFKAEFVGNISNISLMHDPNGHGHSAWRPEEILILSVYLSRAWLFTATNWLSYEGGNQITLKPSTVVYAGRQSCRNISQDLLAFRPQYATLMGNVSHDVDTIKSKLRNSSGLNVLHSMKSENGENGTQVVRFQLQKFTKTSVHMYLLGNIEALGAWNPEKGVRMNMTIAPDGIWRGNWGIELELDSDIDEIKYRYFTMVEGKNEDHQRYIHYGDVQNLRLSFLVSTQIQSEKRILITNDSYEKRSAAEQISVCKKKKPRISQLDDEKKIIHRSKANSTPLKSTSERKISIEDREIFQKENIEDESPKKELPEKNVLKLDNQKKSRNMEAHLQDAYILKVDVHDLAEKESGDRKDNLDDEKKLTLSNLSNLLNSSDEQILQCSSDMTKCKSELDMLKNDIALMNHSFSYPCDDQLCRINASLSCREISFNLERYKRVSTNLSRDIEKWLTNMKKEVWSFNDILNRYDTMVRTSLKEKEKAHLDKLRIYSTEKQFLKSRLAKEFEEKQNLFNELQDLKGNIRVFCRVRPIFGEDKGNCIIPGLELLDRCCGSQNQIEIDGKSFYFQHVFSPSSTQYEVFEKTTGVVRSVLDGYNVCIMAYGQTGSGKSFTMNGEKDNRGVNYRALEDLFKVAEERALQFKTFFCISVLEIYNETLRDLLETKDLQKKLDIRRDTSPVLSGGAVFVQNLTRVQVNSVADSWKCMEEAFKNRTTEKTEMNEQSSRSHLVFKLYVTSEQKTNDFRTSGELSLVDLAGSERFARSKVSGVRLREAQNINKSLSTLGDVFSSLISRSSHIPFRNSKLTYLLQDSLGGSSKTIMFFNISPQREDLTETLSTLQFSQRVAKIERGTAHKNIWKQEEKRTKKSFQSKELELQLLRSKLNAIEKDNKRKTIMLNENEKKSQILEDELKKTREGLERSKQNEREINFLFEKKLKEMTSKNTISKISSVSKDVERRHRGELKLRKKDRKFKMEQERGKRTNFSLSSRSHASLSEGHSKQTLS